MLVDEHAEVLPIGHGDEDLAPYPERAEIEVRLLGGLGKRQRHPSRDGVRDHQLTADHQRIASGFTGEPVARGITSGATTNWNSHRPSSAHAAASGSKSALSRIGIPM